MTYETSQVGSRKSCDMRVRIRWYLIDTRIDLSDIQLGGSQASGASTCAGARRQTLSAPSGSCRDCRRRACCRRRQACACGAQHGPRWIGRYLAERVPSALADSRRSGRPRMTPVLTDNKLRQLLTSDPCQFGCDANTWNMALRPLFPMDNSFCRPLVEIYP
jgi:hypothetical protein